MKINYKNLTSLAMSILLVIPGGYCPQTHVARADSRYVENNILQISNPENGIGKESTNIDGQYVGPSWVGNYIYYGNYPQSLKDGADPSSTNMKDYNNDPIKWRVLDNNNVQYIGSGQIDQTELETNNDFKFNSGFYGDGKGGRQNAPVGGNGILLMSDKLLDHLMYHPDYTDSEGNICWSTSKDSNDKKGSVLWSWLNNKPSSDVYNNRDYKSDEVYGDKPEESFIEKAFTGTEKNGILDTMVYAEDLRKGYSASPVTTISQDKLFVPSCNEVLNTKYGFAGTKNYSNTRALQNTAYSNAKSTEDIFSHSNNVFWTRTRSLYGSGAAYFKNTGEVNYSYNMDVTCVAWLAALNLNQGAVIFASLAAESGQSGAEGAKDGAIGAEAKKFELPTGYDNEYKLTMQGDHDGFSITNKPASLKKIRRQRDRIELYWSKIRCK